MVLRYKIISDKLSEKSKMQNKLYTLYKPS